MPYIKPLDRITRPTSGFLGVGELNYRITTLVNEYLVQQAMHPRENRVGVRYDHINAAIGVLTCATLELYRRIGAPYEDVACHMNGDVYSPEIMTP